MWNVSCWTPKNVCCVTRIVILGIPAGNWNKNDKFLIYKGSSVLTDGHAVILT